MKNRRQSLRRRIKRGRATILWDFVLSKVYAADIPKRGERNKHRKGWKGRESWLKMHKRESEYAANYLRRGRAYSEGTPEHAK